MCEGVEGCVRVLVSVRVWRGVQGWLCEGVEGCVRV